MLLGLACLLAFLLGAVPWALLLVRACKGVDVRSVGSGNVGATNASRAFATPAGRAGAFAAIYVLDALKGFVPAAFGPAVAPDAPRLLAAVLCGAAAVLGHVFTPFLRFRGGKGVATATGVLFALDSALLVGALVAFLVVRLLTGKVFMGSLALGLALAVGAVAQRDDAFGERLPLTVLCLLLAALMFWTHRSNLKKHFAAKKVAGA